MPVGEAVAISCPLLSSQQSNRNVTWYRNGSVIPLMADYYLRIYQQRNLLWLIPAKKEDSGFYECHIGYVCVQLTLSVSWKSSIIGLSVDISEQKIVQERT